MSSVLPTAAEVDILTVLFIGFMVATMLYGLSFFQTYIYFSRYPKDSLSNKAIVILLCALDSTTTALMSQALYFYLVTQFSVDIGFLFATTSFCVENGLAILVTFIVQLYYITRVWTVTSKSWLLASIIASISFVGFAFGIAMTVQIFRNKRLADLATPHMQIVASISQAFSALADVLIVATMSYFLRAQRYPHMVQPNGWVCKITNHFLTRGVGFMVIQIAYFWVFVVMPSKQIWIPFHLVVSKLYICTLLGMLNFREVNDGRGINEEDNKVKRASVPTLSGVRFNALNTKLTQGSLHFDDAYQVGSSHTVVVIDKRDSDSHESTI